MDAIENFALCCCMFCCLGGFGLFVMSAAAIKAVGRAIGEADNPGKKLFKSGGGILDKVQDTMDFLGK